MDAWPICLATKDEDEILADVPAEHRDGVGGSDFLGLEPLRVAAATEECRQRKPPPLDVGLAAH